MIRLTPADAERYMRHRLRMLTAAPWAFYASPEDDRALDPEHVAALFARADHATFAIEAERSPYAEGAAARNDAPLADLAASASLTRANPPKYAHRARVWGVFVEPAYRSRGLGRALIQAVIERGRNWPGVAFLDLGVSANSPEAQRLYESLGFEVWGREPETTEHAGRRYDEIYMTLRL